MKLIDADKIHNELWVRICNVADGIEGATPSWAFEVFKDAPEIEGERHGEWKINCDGWYPYCSECGNEPQSGKLTKYCPNCGALMDKAGRKK